MTTKYKSTSILTLLTPLLLIIVVFLMGGGHGLYAPAIMLFPTGLISFSFFHKLETPFIILAILQFPIYGFIVDKSINRPKAILLLICFHVILVMITFSTVKNLL